MPEIPINRITIDLDGSKRLKKLKFLNKYFLKQVIKRAEEIVLPLLSNYGFEQYEVKISTSGRGLHITAWHSCGYYKDKLIEIRKLAKDDPMRCWLDSRPHRHINVLFNKKEVKNNGKHTRRTQKSRTN